ncbi:N-acetylmuramoyl-L-alanine amidase [Flavobacteriaceae bacterium 3-367]
MKTGKIAVVVGHNNKRQGAQAITPIDRSEFDFNSELASRMLDSAENYEVELKVFTRRYQGSYTKEIQKVYGEVNTWGAEFSMELHFNSAYFTAAGSEVFSSGTPGSLRFANLAQLELVTLFKRAGKTDRGVKVRKKGARGYLSLVSGRAPAILVEPFFGSNRSDVLKMHRMGLQPLAEAYLRAMEAVVQQTLDLPPPPPDS